jgi:hypothetical protein
MNTTHDYMMEAKRREEERHFNANKREILGKRLEKYQQMEMKIWSIYHNQPDAAERLAGPYMQARLTIENELSKMGVTWQELVNYGALCSANENVEKEEEKDDSSDSSSEPTATLVAEDFIAPSGNWADID